MRTYCAVIAEICARSAAIIQANAIAEHSDQTEVPEEEFTFGRYVRRRSVLVYQGCAIYPESVITAAGEDQISEHIGTGPYQFVEWNRGQSIRLERFADYAALPGEPNGYGGHKYAYLGSLEFFPVSDEAARVAGLRGGLRLRRADQW